MDGQSPACPPEPPGKSKKTEVGSLSPSPGDLPDPGIEPGSPALQADSLPTELSGKPKNVYSTKYLIFMFDNWSTSNLGKF